MQVCNFFCLLCSYFRDYRLLTVTFNCYQTLVTLLVIVSLCWSKQQLALLRDELNSEV